MNILDWKKLLRSDKKQKPGNFLILLLIGMLFLILSIPTKDDGRNESLRQESGEAESTEQVQTQEKFLENAQTQLKDILESIEGVGKVKVMITLKNDGVTIIDKNKKESKDAKESQTVIYDRQNESVPYVTSQQAPEIEGVLVVAQGGGNANVDADISEAIMALFDVEVHKIKIVKMSE